MITTTNIAFPTLGKNLNWMLEPSELLNKIYNYTENALSSFKEKPNLLTSS